MLPYGPWRDPSFRTRLSVLFLVVAVLPLAAVTAFDAAVSRTRVLDAARAQNLERANGTAQAIEAYFGDRIADLRTYSAAPDVVTLCASGGNPAARARVTATLRHLSAAQNFHGLYVTDQSGKVLATTSGSWPEGSYQTGVPFLNAIANRTAVDNPTFDKGFGVPLFRIGAPVHREDGRIVGTIVGLFGLGGVDALVARDTGFGGRGEFGVLWTDQGIRLTDPAHPELQFTPIAPLPEDADLRTRQRLGPAFPARAPVRHVPEVHARARWLLYDRYASPHVRAEMPALGAAHVAIVPLPNRRWLYGIFLPEQRLLAAMRGELRRDGAVAALAGLFALLLGVVTAGRVAKPVRGITAAANAMARGDLQARAKLSQRDEIGRLGAAFDDMADALLAKDAELRAHAAELERRVAERTAAVRALEEASTALNESLDLEETSRTLVNLLAPRVADLCLVHVREGRAGGHSLHAVRAAAALQDVADRLARDPAAEGAVEGLASRSIPLSTGTREFGRLLLVNGNARGGWSDGELALAEEIARRGSLALANALLYREAQDANRLKDEFLGTVSHELRTPLNAILGWSRILAAQTPNPAQVRRAVETIERNARAQAQLVDELLDASRITTGKLVLDVRSVDLADIVRSAAESAMPTAAARRIALTVDADVAVISGDPHRLHQVCWNLLTNALKFTPEGGRVHVTVRTRGRAAELSVQDTGLGITADFLPHVFEPFRQADSTTTRLFGGLGLGLALVRRIVELHGGTVSARSAGQGHGSVFTVTLPAPLGLAVEPPPRAPAADAALLRGRRFLVVDDQQDSREFLASLLESAGAGVTLAASGAEAMACLEADAAPDALLADIGMPGEDGYALLRRIRAHPAPNVRQVPAVAVTAYAGVQHRDEALAAGFDAHVPKPVDPDAVVGVLVTLLARSTAV